LNLSWK